MNGRTQTCTTIRDVMHWMILIWDATVAACFSPAGWGALLLPRPAERERGLPRGLIHLQRPAVSQWWPLTLAVWTISAETFILLLLTRYRLPSLSFAPLLPGSGMFDDGLHMYLIEPLQPTHLAVSCSTKRSTTSVSKFWLMCYSITCQPSFSC